MREGVQIGQVEGNPAQDLMNDGSNEEEQSCQDESQENQIQNLKAINPLVEVQDTRNKESDVENDSDGDHSNRITIEHKKGITAKKDALRASTLNMLSYSNKMYSILDDSNEMDNKETASNEVILITESSKTKDRDSFLCFNMYTLLKDGEEGVSIDLRGNKSIKKQSKRNENKKKLGSKIKGTVRQKKKIKVKLSKSPVIQQRNEAKTENTKRKYLTIEKQSNLKKNNEAINLTSMRQTCVNVNAKNSEPLIRCLQCFKSHWPHKKACIRILSKKEARTKQEL